MCDHCAHIDRTAAPDVQVENEGTVHVLNFNTPEALAWAHEHIESEPWMWLGTTRLVVDQRYSFGLVQGMMEHGLVVR